MTKNWGTAGFLAWAAYAIAGAALGVTPAWAHETGAVAVAAAADAAVVDSVAQPPLTLAADDRLITILGTNDIHGGIDAGVGRDGKSLGGMSYWAGVARAIRKGIIDKHGAERAGVLTVDAGDQFQGTLLSNYSEGVLMFQAMSQVGYDAVVPGNHDYDFGPVGWLEDQVSSTTPVQNRDPRGALLRAMGSAEFPLISANTYLRSSLVDRSGDPVAVNGAYCKPVESGARIDWSKARLPGFVQPYVMKTVAGVRVALIGLDNPGTPSSTTPANVSDLCFGDAVNSFIAVQKSLKGKADVFVAIMHEGNTANSFGASDFVRKLTAKKGRVDAVVSGHTHYTTNARENGVAVIQSGSGGLKFGRIDLVYSMRKRKVDASKTRAWGGVELQHGECAPAARDFCSAGADGVFYEGVAVVADAGIEKLVREAKGELAPVAGRKLGVATATVRVDRTRESALANFMTDGLREISGAEIAFMNAGGIRAPLAAGEITYEAFFKVLPFNNRGLIIGPMDVDKVLALLERSITTCGAFGALMQSGLRVTFERDCKQAQNQLDRNARLLTVTTLDGEVLYDDSRGGKLAALGRRAFRVATLDFLAAGGSGFSGFKDTPVIQDLGIVREALTEHYLRRPVTLDAEIDGRWAEQPPYRQGEG